MKLDRLQELKQNLAQAENLSGVWSFYMDHFADHQAFTNLGESKHNDFLVAVIPEICQQMFGRKIDISGLMLTYIAEHQFFHGSFEVEGRIGCVIYFKDAKLGLLAVVADNPPTDAIHYSRFSEPPGMQSAKSYKYN